MDSTSLYADSKPLFDPTTPLKPLAFSDLPMGSDVYAQHAQMVVSHSLAGAEGNPSSNPHSELRAKKQRIAKIVIGVAVVCSGLWFLYRSQESTTSEGTINPSET